MPTPRARRMIVSVSVTEAASCGRLRTKDWSILSVPAGRSFSLDSEEYPVPKSSIASGMPAASSISRIFAVSSGRPMAADSVTSITSWHGSTPDSMTRASRRSTTTASHSPVGKLNEIRRPTPRARQRRV